jgi:hypothetical protein
MVNLAKPLKMMDKGYVSSRLELSLGGKKCRLSGAIPTHR